MIYNPLEEYLSKFRDLHKSNTETLFEELVKKSLPPKTATPHEFLSPLPKKLKKWHEACSFKQTKESETQSFHSLFLIS